MAAPRAGVIPRARQVAPGRAEALRRLGNRPRRAAGLLGLPQAE